MVRTSIGELKLSPIKEDGKYVFYNDFITINGKVAKGDRINIFVMGYDEVNGKHIIKPGQPAEAKMTVRGEEHLHTDDKNHTTVEAFYEYVTELYKSRFYFGNK